MTDIIVKLEDGSTHRFPEGTTPEEMDALLPKFSGENKSESSQYHHGLLRNLGAGFLEGLRDTANIVPAITGLAPDKYQKYLPKHIDYDPYKMLGVEDKSFTTGEGAEQLLGSLVVPSPLIAGGVSLAGKLIKSGLNKVSPQKYAEKLIGELGAGSKNVDEASKSISKDLMDSFNSKSSEYKDLINPVLNKVKDKTIYSNYSSIPKKGKIIDPVTNKTFDFSELGNLDESKGLIKHIEDLKVGDLFKDFKNKPTFQNAHNLQSELGKMISQIQKTPLSTESYLELKNIKKLRDSLKSHMNNFLESEDKFHGSNLSESYKKSSDFYKNNVVPYLSSKKLRDIVQKGKISSKDIHSIFDTPTDFVNKSGNTQTGPINKILEDLPESTRQKILYSKLGGHLSAKDPIKLVNKFDSIKNKGFSSYIDNTLQGRFKELSNIQQNKEILKKILLGTGGAAGLGVLGHGLYNKYSER